MEVIVGVACAVGGFAISYMTFQRGRDKKVMQQKMQRNQQKYL